MKNILFYPFLFLSIWSCTKVGPDATTPKPEIDFSSKSYITPYELWEKKIVIGCSETSYWEGKTLNIQGFTWASNIDSVGKSFFLYSKYVLADPTQPQIIIYYESKDSLPVTKLLLANKDKHCFLTVTCLTYKGFFDSCQKIIRFTLKRPEDIEFQ